MASIEITKSLFESQEGGNFVTVAIESRKLKQNMF